MKNEFLTFIKESCNDKEKFSYLEKMYTFYEQLQYCEDINEMATVLCDWLKQNYDIDNINFTLFNLDTNKSTVILKQGVEFFLDGELSFYFIINTHTNINAVISFSAKDKEHYDKVNKEYRYIEISFFHISPILQNGIVKKYHIESSSIDSVTQVYNRKYLIEHINKFLELSKNDETNISFLMIGVDRFKAVIDEFDYDIGDLVLVELAKVIYANIKDFDIVARLTGDEFLVALINLPQPDDAIKIAKKIIERFATTQIIVNEQTNQILRKTVSIGISSYPQDGENIEQVIKNADAFLNEAKNKGRGQYAVYTSDELSKIDLF